MQRQPRKCFSNCVRFGIDVFDFNYSGAKAADALAVRGEARACLEPANRHSEALGVTSRVNFVTSRDVVRVTADG